MNLQGVSHPRIGIIGGGPAGSFAALHLIHLSKKRDLAPEILIFEPRDFDKPGPDSCNRCAGILSSRVTRGLNDLGIELPPRIIQSELHSYALHLDQQVIRVHQPDPSRRIVTIFRSGGPRLLKGKPLASLDGFILSQAVDRGAQHIPHRVVHVRRSHKPVIATALNEYEVDLLILATGVNSHAPLSPAFGYRAPKTEIMAQDEIRRPEGWPVDQVNTYFKSPPGLKFGAIIPKNDYLNISLLGDDMTRDSVQDFIITQGLRQDLEYTENSSLCGCNPRIAVGPAHGYYGDRWVAVGDAAVSRLYKDGIGSALYTSKKAMQVALQVGISKSAFGKHYAPYCQRIARDNRYGKFLFAFWDFMLNKPRMLNAWIRALRAEMDQSAETQAHIRIVWGMFTGDEPYRDLIRMGLQPAALRGLLFSGQ